MECERAKISVFSKWVKWVKLQTASCERACIQKICVRNEWVKLRTASWERAKEPFSEATAGMIFPGLADDSDSLASAGRLADWPDALGRKASTMDERPPDPRSAEAKLSFVRCFSGTVGHQKHHHG